MGQKLMTLFFLSLSICLTTGFSNSSDKEKSVTQHLQVAELSERIYQSGPAIAVMLSNQLNPEKRHELVAGNRSKLYLWRWRIDP